jgi:hypothetical protein
MADGGITLFKKKKTQKTIVVRKPKSNEQKKEYSESRAEMIYKILEEKRKEYHDSVMKCILEKAALSKARLVKYEKMHELAVQRKEKLQKEKVYLFRFQNCLMAVYWY